MSDISKIPNPTGEPIINLNTSTTSKAKETIKTAKADLAGNRQITSNPTQNLENQIDEVGIKLIIGKGDSSVGKGNLLGRIKKGDSEINKDGFGKISSNLNVIRGPREDRLPEAPGGPREDRLPEAPGGPREDRLPEAPGGPREDRLPEAPGGPREDRLPEAPGGLSEDQLPNAPGGPRI